MADDRDVSAAPALPHSAASAAAIRKSAREGEHDRYLAALLAPAAVREDLIALAAAVAEIGRIPLMVREPMMGEIRLQWWRDALDTLARGEVTGNPVADRLGAVMHRHGLPLALIVGITEARAFDLYPDPLPDRSALDGYVAKTEGAAFQLALRVLGAVDRGEVVAVAAAAGQAYGRARLLSGLPEALARGRLPLPADAAERLGVAPADLGAEPPSQVARALFDEIARQARAELETLRSKWAAVPAQARAALLPAALIGPHLRAFEVQSAVSLRVPVRLAPLQRVWRIWRAHRTGRV